jgi:hypothetical protein
MGAIMDFKQVLTDIARAIVDAPDQVNVTMTEEGDEVTLVLTVASDDTGMVIGHHGKIAKAIRSLMKAAGTTCGKRVIVEIQ